MKACTCFLLFGVFAYANSSPTKDKRSTPKFNVKETSKNVFAAKNKTVISGKKIPQPHSTVETFTDFVQELVMILNTYNDDIYEDFVHIVDKEIKKTPHRGKNELNNLLAKESRLLMRKPVSAKRAVINQIIDMMRLLKIFDRNVKELIKYTNSLYKNGAKIKFRKILADLEGFSAGYGKSRTKDDFVKLIRDCVRATVLIQTDLNPNVRRKLRKHIDIFLTKIKEFSSVTNSTNNFITIKPAVTKSDTISVEISENITTENKTSPTTTTAHIMEDKKKQAAKTHTSKAEQEYTTIKLENTKKDDKNSQQTKITDSSTNKIDTEVMFYMTTEKPAFVYKSESRSKLVANMFEEVPKRRLVIGQPTATPGKRLTTNQELRREAPPLPSQEPFVEIFDNNNKSTTVRVDLKEYINKIRHLKKQVNRLKTNEINHNSKPSKVVKIDDYDLKAKKLTNKGNKTENLKIFTKQTYEDEAKIQREKNTVKNNEEDEKITHLLKGLQISDEIVENKKDTSSKSNQTTKYTETSTKPIIAPLSTAKDNTVNNKLVETTFKTTKKVDNTVSNMSEDLKQSRVDETATKGTIKVTKDNINGTTPSQTYRRLAQSFPALFEGHKLKEGFYPAHLWD